MKRTGFIGAIGAFIATALLAIAFAAVPVTFADSISSKGRVAAPTADSAVAFRTGCWVGAKADTSTTSVVGLELNDSISAGGGAGCDYVMPGTSFVLGVFGDVSAPIDSFGMDTGADFAWFVGVRPGVLLSERLMGYGLIGYTGQDFDALGVSGAQLTYGAGVELMLAKHISTGVEWRRINLDDTGAPITQDSVGAFLRWRF